MLVKREKGVGYEENRQAIRIILSSCIYDDT